MKKLLTIAALAGVASLTYGQGYVGVANTATTKVSAGGAAAAAFSSASYYFEVLIAPTTVTTINPDNPLSGGWTDAGITATNTSSGRIYPVSVLGDTGGQVPSGFATTATADFAVIGWAANLGPTLADALATWNGGGLASGTPGNNPALTPGATSTYFGVSAVALDIPGAPAGGPYNSIWGTASSGAIPGMNMPLYTIPEPATCALCGLGAAALVIFRRRK